MISWVTRPAREAPALERAGWTLHSHVVIAYRQGRVRAVVMHKELAPGELIPITVFRPRGSV